MLPVINSNLFQEKFQKWHLDFDLENYNYFRNRAMLRYFTYPTLIAHQNHVVSGCENS